MSEQQTAIEQNTIVMTTNVSSLNKSIGQMNKLINSLYNLGSLLNNLGSIISATSALANRKLLPKFDMDKFKEIMIELLEDNVKITKSMKPKIGMTTGKGGSGNAFNAKDAMKGIFAGIKADMGGTLAHLAKSVSTASQSPFGDIGVMIEGAISPLTVMGKMGKSGWNAAGKTMGAMKGAFSSMGPQMAALSLVMEPIMALLNGILAPFQIFTDIFGLYGEIIGQAFLPSIMKLVPVFISFIPAVLAFSEIITAMLPLFIGGLLPTLNLLSVAMEVIAPSFSVLAAVITDGLEPLTNFQNSFGTLTASWSDAVGSFFQPMRDAVEWMQGNDNVFGDWWSGFSDFFKNEGSHKDWWKK